MISNPNGLKRVASNQNDYAHQLSTRARQHAKKTTRHYSNTKNATAIRLGHRTSTRATCISWMANWAPESGFTTTSLRKTDPRNPCNCTQPQPQEAAPHVTAHSLNPKKLTNMTTLSVHTLLQHERERPPSRKPWGTLACGRQAQRRGHVA